MNLGDFIVIDVKVISIDNSIFKIEGSINIIDINNILIIGIFLGIVSNSEINIIFIFKFGVMLIDIIVMFKGKK